jgi:hypothetical protein
VHDEQVRCCEEEPWTFPTNSSDTKPGSPTASSHLSQEEKNQPQWLSTEPGQDAQKLDEGKEHSVHQPEMHKQS